MSLIKLQGNASGTGAFTIAAPNSNTDRTLTLPDATGTVLAAPAGSVTINSSAPSDSLTVDGSGNLGIGSTAPSAKLDVFGATSNQLRLRTASSEHYAIGRNSSTGFLDFAGTQSGFIGYTFGGADGERMRIDSSGNLLLGGGSTVYAKFTVSNNTGHSRAVDMISGASGYFDRFLFNGVDNGSITLVGGGVSYNTTSDYRRKENILPLSGASNLLAQIPVYTFNYIDYADRTISGFLAHEVQAVVPEAVTGFKDEVDDEGNPKYQGIDQSKLVPLLTAALQEALAEIANLKTRLTALEAN